MPLQHRPAPIAARPRIDTPETFRAWLGTWEGKRRTFQRDDVNGTTVVGGYGQDHGKGPEPEKMIGKPVSDADANRWLDEAIAEKRAAVERRVHPHIWERMTPAQQNALVSLAFNVGVNALGKSKTLALINNGDFFGAAGQWLEFNHSKGQAIWGLTRRRIDEVGHFIGDDIEKIEPNEEYRRFGVTKFKRL